MVEPLPPLQIRSRQAIIAAVALLAILTWVYGSVIAVLATRWSSDPSYSHGYIVPLIAAGIAWCRLRQRSLEQLRPSLLGVIVLAIGLATHVGGGLYYYEWADAISIVPSVAGVVLLIGGLALLRATWPAVLFLAFMVPLPYRIESAMSGPLQSVATFASTFVIQLCGFPASSAGNTIAINDVSVGVAEACSGIRMLVIFFAISTAFAILSRRTLLEKVILTFIAPIIAVVCNVVRISSTGILLATSHNELAHTVYHDLAGWLMMPMALGMLWLLLKFLDHLIVEELAKPTPKALARHVHIPAPLPVSNTHSNTLFSPSIPTRL